jgi:hypothetical protein
MTIFLHPPPYLSTKLRGSALHIWGVHDYGFYGSRILRLRGHSILEEHIPIGLALYSQFLPTITIDDSELAGLLSYYKSRELHPKQYKCAFPSVRAQLLQKSVSLLLANRLPATPLTVLLATTTCRRIPPSTRHPSPSLKY